MSNGEQAAPSAEMVPAARGTEMAETFGGRSLARSAETASSAAAATAIAKVQARFIVARQNPRNWDEVRLRVLAECKRPSFAAVALYNKPVGEGIVGLSIRFAEMIMRNVGNIAQSTSTIYDDAEKRILKVAVDDLETNLSFETEIIVEKTVERLKLKDGEIPLSVRTNSVGAKTYRVEATEDQMLSKTEALVSKALRNNALRLLPGDIKDDARAVINETLEKDDQQDPQAAKKKILDAFDKLGIKPTAIRDYLGHELDVILPAELKELRGVWNAVNEGEASWKDSLEFKQKGAAKVAATTAAAEAGKPSSLKDKVAKEAAKAASKPHDKDGVVLEKPAGATAAATAPTEPAATGSADTSREPGVD